MRALAGSQCLNIAYLSARSSAVQRLPYTSYIPSLSAMAYKYWVASTPSAVVLLQKNLLEGSFDYSCSLYITPLANKSDTERMEILQQDSACQRMLAVSVCLLLFSMSSGYILTADEQSPVENWNELVLRCRRADDGSNSVTEEGLLPIRPVRRLGSEFLGKRAIENLCADLVFSDEIDEDWLCQCLHKWTPPSTNDQPIDEETSSAASLNKRGLGAILLSGKRMNNNKWNNNALNRRVMGSEFLGKRALLGSEFLGKRAIMGSEFLGKRGSNGRPNNGPSGTAKIE